MTRGQDGKVAIGIDLGTAFSRIAVWKQDQVHMIPNYKGNHANPSTIAFSETERLFGQEAQDRVSRNTCSTIFDTKRVIGRHFDDKDVQSDMKCWPFKIVSKGGKPHYRFDQENETKELSPEEITAMIIVELHRTAEDHLGAIVTDAVISVPSKFNYSQRQAVINAGTIAGLNVLAVLSEASAAAIALVVHRPIFEDPKTILIIDLGAGSLDVTLITIECDIIEVVATAGDTHLGGRDFDNRLVDDLVQEFKRVSKQDISSNARALARLRTISERTKRTLSTSPETVINIGSLAGDIDFSTTVTRTRFEALNNNIFESILEPIENVLRDSRRDKDSVDEIVLVGGSSRIPKVQQLISDFFGGKRLTTTFYTDEAVAHGTAVYAAILAGTESRRLGDVLLFDVVPHSIGVGNQGVMDTIIKRNTALPTRKSYTFSMDENNLRRLELPILLPVYEGERAHAKDNTMIGLLHISDFRMAVPQIEIDFDIDPRRNLKVRGTDRMNGDAIEVYIHLLHLAYLPTDEMKRKIQTFVKYKAEDGRPGFEFDKSGGECDVADFRSLQTSFD